MEKLQLHLSSIWWSFFQENVSFDHYFATYPNAKNLRGEPKFSPLSNAPSINGLTIGLLTNNTNLANPWRLGKSQVVTVASCDPNHSYTALQKEIDGGLMDKFVQNSALSIHKNKKIVWKGFSSVFQEVGVEEAEAASAECLYLLVCY